jgi:threonine/homoserine/homoserine lactone efflux protein
MPALLAIFGTSFVIALSGALMPGPLLTVTIGETMKRGFWAGPLIILGHAILELALVALLLLGLGPLLKSDTAFVVIALCGAAMLAWMAAGMFRAVPSLSVSAAAPAKRPGAHPVVSGIVMSLANPYWTIWWAAIGLGYITYSVQFGAAGLILFFSGHILADLAWYTFISLSFSKGRQFMSDTVYRRIIGVCATALAGFAVWFAVMGVRRI